MSSLRCSKPGLETAVALIATAFFAIVLLMAAMYVGPLWRDEVNTANLAQMPSWTELWHNLPCESFPPLWPLMLRGCGFLGLAGSDAGIRVVGFYVGLIFLGSLWLTARWLKCRAPIISIALLGSLPAFVFIVGANRAYGLASCLLVLSFGLIWRMVELPSRTRVLLAGITSLLFANCVYFDGIFLAGMLGGGALVTMRRQDWKTLAALVGIGTISAASLLIYLPIIRRGADYVPMVQWPAFTFASLWNGLGDALTARSSGEMGHNGPEVWLWIGLILGGSVLALLAQRARAKSMIDPKAAVPPFVRDRADLALYCAVSMLVGVVGMMAFLARLHYLPQSWYFIEMLCLCAVSLDGLLGGSRPALRPGGMLRIGFLVVMMSWGGKSAWTEAHTRRSNVDLIATVLEKNAVAGDLIVVQAAWEGITFNRYYHGAADWVTVPPIESHLVHRNDLVLEKIRQPNAMEPVLKEMAEALQGGHAIWLVGYKSAPEANPPPANQSIKWLGTHLTYWEGQVMGTLLNHALQEQVVQIPPGAPVCYLEDLPLSRFTGYKAGNN